MRHSPLLACLLCCLAPLVQAAQLYRYIDDKGVTVLDRQGVPPQYIGNGYQVLDGQGRVISVVPPAPTAEERAALAAKRAQRHSDEKLLRLYSSVADVDHALQRKLAEIDSVAGIARGNLQSLQLQQSNLRSEAAAAQRAGNPVSEATQQQMQDLRSEQARLERDLQRYESDRQEAQAAFAADRERLAELLGSQ